MTVVRSVPPQIHLTRTSLTRLDTWASIVRWPNVEHGFARLPLPCSQPERRLTRLVNRSSGVHGTRSGGTAMDQTQQLLALVLAACVGLLATFAILRGRRRAVEPPRESPFAAATEGQKLCRRCGMGNQATDDRCISCGATLPG